MAKKLAKESEEIEVTEPAEEAESPKKKASDKDKVKIKVLFPMKLGKQKLMPGVHYVERHQVASIREIQNKKMRSELAMYTGKNFLISRLIDNRLVIKEAADLDLKKL